MPSTPRPTAVLIFEDDIDLAQQWASALQDGGITAHYATSFREAQQLCLQQPYDLVISDMMIKDAEGNRQNQGGYSMVTYLRDTAAVQAPSWGKAVPILMVTGSLMARQYRAFKFTSDWRPMDAMLKPFTVEALVDKVRSMLAADHTSA